MVRVDLGNSTHEVSGSWFGTCMTRVAVPIQAKLLLLALEFRLPL